MKPLSLPPSFPPPHIRTQPDSTRDQDLRELIAQRRKEKSHHSHHHRQGSDRDHTQQEGSDGEIDDDYDEGEGGGGGRHQSSVSSVVKLVHTERYTLCYC